MLVDVFQFLMYKKKIRVMCWTVRGLGDVKNCDVVKNIIRRSRCDIVCLQDTKWNKFDFAYISCVLPSFFHRGVFWVDANNLAGGIFIAWKHAYTLINSFATRHTCTVVLQQASIAKLTLHTRGA